MDLDLGEYSEQKISDLREDTGSFKLDWVPTDKSQFSFRYNINDSLTEVPYGVGTDQIADGKLRTQLFKFSHNYAFGATTTNEFGLGVNHNFTRTEAGHTDLPRFDLSFVNFRINPVGALYWSQVLAGVLSVPILLFILLLSNDRRIMRTTNSGLQNFWLGAAVGGLITAGLILLFRKILLG